MPENKIYLPAKGNEMCQQINLNVQKKSSSIASYSLEAEKVLSSNSLPERQTADVRLKIWQHYPTNPNRIN